MFSKYFQSELTYLREMGREFATTNPSLAGMFAERGGDPDVERLLEGFAFLTARIRERIDDAVPEVIDAVAELMIPQCVRPTPACSVLELLPSTAARKSRHLVPRGAEVASREVAGTSCVFRTTHDVELLPLAIAECTLDTARAQHPEIHVGLRLFGAGAGEMTRDATLRLFVHGPTGQASAVFLWLMHQLESATVHAPDGSVRRLPPDPVRAASFDPESSMLPWPELAPDGLRLAQEYFTLGPAMHFVDVRLGDALASGALEEAKLVFRFDRPPPLPERLDPSTFRLNCVPVINLFQVSADPVSLDVRQHEHLLRASGWNPHHMEIYSVDSVVGLVSGGKQRRQYEPFFRFSHLARGRSGAYFTLRRARSPIDDALDTYLSVLTPKDVAPEVDEEVVLSIDLTCTNRSLPTELRVGDISRATPKSPSLVQFRNITQVSRPARAPVGDEMRWRLVSQLALNVSSLTEPAALRGILANHNVPSIADHQVNRANMLRIEAISEVRTEPGRRIVGRAPVRGFETLVALEESAFASAGDAYVFGCVLDFLFASQVPINSYHQLTVVLRPNGTEFRWPPRTGTQPIF